jgi:hypothetical protein
MCLVTVRMSIIVRHIRRLRGDLSHHFDETPAGRAVQEAIAWEKRIEYVSGSKLEPIAISIPPQLLVCVKVDADAN